MALKTPPADKQDISCSELRPPKRIASIGTPVGSSQLGAIDGHWPAGTVKRALGWLDGSAEAGVQSLRR